MNSKSTITNKDNFAQPSTSSFNLHQRKQAKNTMNKSETNNRKTEMIKTESKNGINTESEHGIKTEPKNRIKTESKSGIKTESKYENKNGMQFNWDLSTSIAEDVDCDVDVVRVVVSLLDDDNTIPFIARYRKEQTRGLGPEKLREVKEKLDELREVQEKAVKAVVKVEALGQMDSCLKSALLSAKSLSEVEHLYSPYKPASKRTLAQKAQDLGLLPYAESFIKSAQPLNLHNAIDRTREGLSSVAEIRKGVEHCIASIISKDERILSEMRKIYNKPFVSLSSKLLKSAGKTDIKTKTKSIKGNSSTNQKSKKSADVDKFQEYSSFQCSVDRIKPHQVLAINRGESLKILSSSVIIPDHVRQSFITLCKQFFVPAGCNKDSYSLIMESSEDAYKRLIHPLLCRHIRSRLNETAEKASISVFVSNLKNLLLTPPVRGKMVLGLDPGFSNGCKYAMISCTGKVEATGVAYLHKSGSSVQSEIEKLKNVILKYRCETIAIGNGVGCRETESLISKCIKQSTFHPLNVSFSIVSEDGASIYSASELAATELPDLDVSVRGAVSIARRLQDPLSELVKIDPKNIGVGMYQHDVSEKKLKSSLDGVVEDCVSFVGADLNIASEVILSNVAGIGPSLAKKIVKHREVHGPFMNRSQLTTIAGLGPKTFKQCAGFLRIMPDTAVSSCDAVIVEETTKIGGKRKLAQSSVSSKKQKMEVTDSLNPLDMTGIHPESYTLATRLIRRASLQIDATGQPSFIQHFKTFLNSVDLQNLVKEFHCELATLQQISDELSRPVGYDIRDGNQKPLFRQNVMSMSDLSLGLTVTGRVTNVTHFGSFVDIGVGKAALLHNNGMTASALQGRASLNCGDRIEATVERLELERERIGLKLTRVL